MPCRIRRSIRGFSQTDMTRARPAGRRPQSSIGRPRPSAGKSSGGRVRSRTSCAQECPCPTWFGSPFREGSGSLEKVVNIPEPKNPQNFRGGYVISSSGPPERLLHRSIPISYTADWPCDVQWIAHLRSVTAARSRDLRRTARITDRGWRVISRRSASGGNQMPPLFRHGLHRAWLGPNGSQRGINLYGNTPIRSLPHFAGRAIGLQHRDAPVC